MDCEKKPQRGFVHTGKQRQERFRLQSGKILRLVCEVLIYFLLVLFGGKTLDGGIKRVKTQVIK